MDPEVQYVYTLKMINPSRLSDFKTVNIRGTRYCETLEELKEFISCNLPTSITDPPDFSVVELGYLESGHGSKGRKVWLCDDEDLAKMYRENKGKKILLWCYTGESQKKKPLKQPLSREHKKPNSGVQRSSNYESYLNRAEEVEKICQTLKEKHGSMYKPEQLRTWAHMIHVGTHVSLDEPPDKPFFRGVKRSQADASSPSSTPEKKKATPVSLSPGRRVNIRSELIDQLKKCQELVDIGAISQENFQELQDTILFDIKRL